MINQENYVKQYFPTVPCSYFLKMFHSVCINIEELINFEENLCSTSFVCSSSIEIFEVFIPFRISLSKSKSNRYIMIILLQTKG